MAAQARYPTRTRADSDSSTERPTRPTKKLKSEPSAFDKLIRDARRDQRKGIDGDTAERVLESLRCSPIKDAHAYPTPDSARDSVSESGDMDLGMDLNKLMARVPEGVTFDADILADARCATEGGNQSGQSGTRLDWDGFWEGSERTAVRGFASRCEPLLMRWSDRYFDATVFALGRRRSLQ